MAFEMTRQGRGGRREGSGRPKTTIKRKRRALDFFDEEWELIRNRAEERGMVPREYLYTLLERDIKGEGLNRPPDSALDGVDVTFSLRKDLADQIPKDSAELQAYIIRLIESELDPAKDEKKALRADGRILGTIKSERKAITSAENGRKGGRPKKNKNPAI